MVRWVCEWGVCCARNYAFSAVVGYVLCARFELPRVVDFPTTRERVHVRTRVFGKLSALEWSRLP